MAEARARSQPVNAASARNRQTSTRLTSVLEFFHTLRNNGVINQTAIFSEHADLFEAVLLHSFGKTRSKQAPFEFKNKCQNELDEFIMHKHSFLAPTTYTYSTDTNPQYP